jgi:AcrR family transcriptional regulator
MTPTGTRAPRADAVRNRARLLAAAREAFGSAGVAASLDDVARAAGVGPGTLYRHLPTRDHLVLAVIDEGLRGIAALGVELRRGPDPVAALEQWLTAYVAQAGVFEGLAGTLATTPEADSAGKEACHAASSAGAALVGWAVATGQLRADIDFADVLDMAAAIAWVGEQPDRAPEQQARLLRILLNGLRVPATHIT